MSDFTAEDQVDERAIAIIGMAGRFPQARTLDQLWDNLKHGREAVSFFSDEELLAAGVSPQVLADPQYVKAGTHLEDIECFDAPFFGYTPREAEIMDPQQRLFLECAWSALEHAGYDSERYDGTIGIYAGVAWNTYLLSNLSSHPELFEGGGAFQVFITNDKDFMPTKLSYKLNLKGPSMIIQTSCSTSLVAVHMACLSLQDYDCDMALVGGVTVKVPQISGYFHQEEGITSPDGHCRPFDARAQGTIFGSGAGVVVLKRLADALADGDSIHAVIKGSAINNDGSLKVSYTAPSVDGQAEVVAAAQTLARTDPETIGYIEAHGTGTALGDPIEVAALSKVFQERTARRQFCALGSIKSNLGHLDAAAGIAGLLKTVLALKHRQLPPSLHYETPNPRIDFAASPFYVNTSLSDWTPPEGLPRRAGVSSFGVGGTNAHVILEEAPAQPPSPSTGRWQLLLLSAKSEGALERMTDGLAEALAAQPALSLADVAYTLQLGRKEFPHRRALVCQDLPDAVAALRTRDPQRLLAPGQADERSSPPNVGALLRSLQQRQGDEQRLLAELGQHWLDGAAIDWQELYAGQRRRRVPLPTYAFDRHRYWIAPRSRAALETSPAQTGKRPDPADWFYLPSWKRALPPRPARPELGAPAGPWLIFADTHGLGAELSGLLGQGDQPVIMVVPGEGFEQVDDGIYRINPRQRGDYVALLEALQALEATPAHVVHLWSVAPAGDEPASSQQFDDIQWQGFYSLLFLAQALEQQGIEQALQIDLVSSGLQRFAGEPALCPAKATLLGLCKVLPQERPQLSCRSIDIVLAELEARRPRRLVEQLLAELQAPASAEVIAYRDGQRWVQSYEPARLETAAQPLVALRQRGVYLITGGLADLGLALAQLLARTAQPTLALVEGLDFPARERWDDWLAEHGEQDQTSLKLKQARRLEQLGASVELLRADLCSSREMSELVDQLVQRHGGIHGVIHAAAAAGDVSFQLVQELDPATALAHFQPKAHALIALAQAVEALELDFCLLTSSLVAVLGGRGYAAYAAANSFMDAFAQSHSRTARAPWISLGWDVWQLDDASAPVMALSASLAELALTQNEIELVFQHVLETGAGERLVISTGDLAARIDQQARSLAASRRQAAQPEASRPMYPRPQLASTYVSAGSELEQSILQIWQRALGIEPIGIDDNFFELGGDSLIAIQVVSQLKKQLGFEITAAKLYQGLTIRTLAQLLSRSEEQAAEQLAAQLEERKEQMSRRKQFQQMRRSHGRE